MTRPRVSNELDQMVRERAHGRCEYCLSQEAYSPDRFSIEHIMPQIEGGQSTSGNLALACQCCNNHKYKKTHALDPFTGEVVSLFHPRNDRWHEHFMWNDDYTLIIGLSSTGRASIAALHLNRESVVNLRRLLLLIGEHPQTEHKSE